MGLVNTGAQITMEYCCFPSLNQDVPGKGKGTWISTIGQTSYSYFDTECPGQQIVPPVHFYKLLVHCPTVAPLV